MDCYELDEDAASKLIDQGFDAEWADFLTIYPTQTYDRVVMNPPFTKGQAEKHIIHAAKFVAPGGRLVSVMPAADQTARYQKMLDALTELKCGHYRVFELPQNSFKASGTGANTMIFTCQRKG